MSYQAELQNIEGIVFSKDKDLTSFTTFRLAAVGDLIEVKSIAALQALLPLLKRHQQNYLVVGWGANQILPAVCPTPVIHLDFPFTPEYLTEPRDQYELPASLGINHLTSHAVKFGLLGWEVFTGIPASLGGAIFMNAGTNLGEIGTLVKSVRLVTPDGEIREEVMTPSSFSYRRNHFVRPGEIIVGATLVHRGRDPQISQKIKDYLNYRKSSQPLATRNCGCVFKNPMKEMQAGRLIDLLGLKGIQSGALKISPKHANFMENTGAASWENFQRLVETVQFQMNVFYGLEFELEVKIPYD